MQCINIKTDASHTLLEAMGFEATKRSIQLKLWLLRTWNCKGSFRVEHPLNSRMCAAPSLWSFCKIGECSYPSRRYSHSSHRFQQRERSISTHYSSLLQILSTKLKAFPYQILLLLVTFLGHSSSNSRMQ